MQRVDPIKITEGVHWVGALDPDLRVFDVIMETRWGTTYNSYIVEGSQKRALIEGVKDVFGDSHLDTVRQVIDPASIDYIVINHAEPDHSGSLRDLLTHTVNATVLCSRPAATFLKDILNVDFPCRVVRDGRLSTWAVRVCDSSPLRSFIGRTQCSPICPKTGFCSREMCSAAISAIRVSSTISSRRI